MLKFIIPNRDDDLLEVSKDAFYVSELVDDTDDILKALNRFQSKVNKGEFEGLEDYFDAFFATARHNEDIGFDIKIRVFEALATGFRSLTQQLRSHVSDMMNAAVPSDDLSEVNDRYRNYLLMYLYLLSRISYHIESYVTKKTRAVDQKNRKGAANAAEDYTVSFWCSCDGRLRLLGLFFGIVTIDAFGEDGHEVRAGVKFLFPSNIMNEQLVTCIVNAVMKILDNPDTAKATGKNILIASFHVLRAMCVGWEQTNLVAMSIIELAAKFEYFQKPGVTNFHFVDVILQLQVKDEMQPLLAAMITYLGNFDPQGFAAGGEISSKAFCLFITTLSERDPHLMLKNIAPIVSFLSNDPPALRNAMLTAFAEIASRCFDENQGEESRNLEKQKRTMFARLQDHIVDQAALVRTRVLHVWEKLAVKNAIPPEQFRLLLISDIGGRLKDNSVMVRKAAVSLLTEIVSHNRFGSDLFFTSACKQLAKIKKEHTELLTRNPEYDILHETNKKFDAEIEPAIKKMLELCLDEFVLSDTLQLERINRNWAVHRKSFSFLQNGDEQSDSDADEDQDLVDDVPAAVEDIAHEALGLSEIASMILDPERRLTGTVAYLKMFIDQNKESFQRDMDVQEMTEKLCKLIRNLILQHSLTKDNQDEEQYVIDEDRINEFQSKLYDLERSIEANLEKLFFIAELEKCLPEVGKCIKLGQVPEIQDMIKFICECCKFKIRGAAKALKEVFHLIWRKDTTITEIVIEAGYEAMFSTNSNVDIRSKKTAKNLLDMMMGADDEEGVSLEETLMRIISKKKIDDQTVDVFWELSKEEDSLSDKLIAIRLLGVVAKSYNSDQKRQIRLQLGRLVKLYKCKNEQVRLEVLKIIVSLASSNDKESSETVPRPTSFRIPSSDKLLKTMCVFLVTELQSAEAVLWVPHCREVVNVLFGCCARPYKMISFVFSRMTSALKRTQHDYNSLFKAHNNLRQRLEILATNQNGNPGNAEAEALDPYEEIKLLKIRKHCLERLILKKKPRLEIATSRLLYFVGEVALKFLTYIEVIFTRELKSCLQLIHDIRQMDIGDAEKQDFISFAEDKDAPLIQFEKDCIRQRGFFEKADREDDRIGLTAISEEEKLQMKLQKILDKDTFGGATINGRILPFVVLVLKGHLVTGEAVKESAIQCLAKLMLVNRKCCKRFLPLFFHFYEGASVRARNNMIILMTDLCFRFPNVFNVFNNDFIKKIRDENPGIRYTCLLVLSHMLLNDLIKVSGRIAEIAPCLCDDDPKIRHLARCFFTEISKKHNVLYNTMPDIISKLTTNKELRLKDFEDVMRFLLDFIVQGKDQHKESLVEKLCQRFQLLKTFRYEGHIPLPEALSFCIAQIPLNDRIFRRLTENLRCYQEFLTNPSVYKNFTATLSAFKKNSSKSLELKAQIEDFEAQIQKAFNGEINEEMAQK